MEKAAAGYLKAQGVHILESNFRTREAEIDLIGRQGRTLLFVEVKARQKEGKRIRTPSSIKKRRLRK